jgi:ACS family hexuronate transporter-like MFS transporter
MSLRFLLGMGEAGNFPAGIKAISEWFPPKERATATGIFNFGAGTGAVLAPPMVGFLLLWYGWQAAFIITSSIGFVWAVAWFFLYDTPEKHPRLSPAELAHIRSGQEHYADDPTDRARGGWGETFSRWEIWPIMAARVLTDPVWLFYIMWLPDYLNRARGFDLTKIALFAWIPFLAADAGSLFGGSISSWFVRRGWPTLKARKAAMCLCASLMPVSLLAVRAESPITAIVFICIATFSGQSWGASFLTLPADLFPKRIVGSAYGLTAACGFLAGAASTLYLGRVVDTVGYIPVFTLVGFMHLVGTAILVVAIRPARQPVAVALVPERA